MGIVDQPLELIELYEYKVEDLLNGRTPRGGRRGMLELRELLVSLELDATLTRRFSRVDRLYRAMRREGTLSHSAITVALPTTSETPPGAPERGSTNATAVRGAPEAETQVWQELQKQVWFGMVQEKLRRLVDQARSEPGHSTLRVVYAVTETAERALRGERTPFPVPKSDDPLMSLGDREIAQQLGQTLTELLSDEASSKAVMEALAEVQLQPFPRHPDEDVLAARIEAAEREPISQLAREDLIKALRRQYPQAADPRERPAIRQAADRLQIVLDALLSARPRPSAAPPDSILYAEHPQVALAIPPEAAQELIVYLGGQVQDAYWHGLHLRWQLSGKDWQFQVGKQLMLLRPSLNAHQRVMKVREGGEEVQLYHSGDYVLLRHVAVPQVALQQLAVQAQVAALLLDPAESYANLRLARAVARSLRDGEMDPDQFAPEEAAKYDFVAADDLMKFARQGSATLVARSRELSTERLSEVFDLCGIVLNISDRRVRQMRHALEHVVVHTHAAPEEAAHGLRLRSDGEFEAVQLSDEPLNMQFQGRTLTLNWDYKRDLVVLLPGAAGASTVLEGVLVVPLHDVSVLLVRQGNWVAATTVPTNSRR